ncbi:MAG: RDD family protein [candidate division Zixibacteria bacterium]|nr:RDD family protein [candidate division Zixibacteria bacterium]
MNAWWYTYKGKQTGPIEKEAIGQLFLSKKIGSKTMMWREGMDSWRPLEEIDELNELRTAVPPPLPTKEIDPLTYPLATCWTRFLARIFDVWWEMLLLTLVIGIVLGYLSSTFVTWLNAPGGSQIFGFLCLPVSLIFDAALYRYGGNTPGKALLGLKVGTLDGKPLSFSEYAERNASVWISGFALGIPFINLFTMIYQARRLGRGQQASYDEAEMFRVRAKPLGWVRKTVPFGIGFVTLLIIMVGLYGMEQTGRYAKPVGTGQGDYSWENPVTRHSAKIDSGWKYSVQPENDDNLRLYTFTEKTGHAMVSFGFEESPDYALDDYIRAFKESIAAELILTDGGRYIERGDRLTWLGSGFSATSPSSKFSAEIAQNDSAFWRIIAFQSMPYDYSDAFVRQLNAALWSTVK